MRNIKLPGCTENVGKRQGYNPIDVLYTTEDVRVGDEVKSRSVCKVAYQLDPGEVTALLEGGKVVITMLGNQVVAHRLEVMTS